MLVFLALPSQSGDGHHPQRHDAPNYGGLPSEMCVKFPMVRHDLFALAVCSQYDARDLRVRPGGEGARAVLAVN